MAEETLSDDRARTIRRLLLVTLALAGVVLVLGLLYLLGGDGRGATTLIVIACIFGALGWLSLRAVDGRSATARRLVLTTGIVVVVLSVLLVGVFVGLITVIAGIGLIAVMLAPERDAG